MSSVLYALIAFAVIFGGALFGVFLKYILPDHHLNDNGRDVVKLGSGLVGTLSALVLGLLINSANSSLDSMNSELTQSSAQIIVLDRVLANYGPETEEIRSLLKARVAMAIELLESGKKTDKTSLLDTSAAGPIEKLQHKLRTLAPRNESQSLLQTQALQLAENLAHARWLLVEQAGSTMPHTFLLILLFWLTVLFVCFGLLAPGNATVLSVLFVCAASVSGAIFLILELNSPLTGIINVSSAPLRNAMEHLGK